MEVKIEKNIPIPEKIIGRKTDYPFKFMKVGDSVFFPGESRNGKVRNAAYQWFRRKKQGVIIRKENDGIRVWRTS